MNPKQGDIFLVPTLDGKFVPGQIISFETRSLHCVSCGLFDQRVADYREGAELILDKSKLFTTLLMVPRFLQKHKWPILQNQNLVISKDKFPYEKELRKNGVGVKIQEEEIVIMFVNAFYGLRAWDDLYKPDFFDEMLLDVKKRPNNLIYSKK